MANLRALYFLGQQFLGESVVRPVTAITRSRLYWCPECGEAWARIVVEGMPWAASARHCPSHGPAFLFPAEPEFPSLPLEAAKRELLLLASLGEIESYPSHLSREHAL